MLIRSANAADLTGITRVQSLSPEAAQWNPADYLGYDCTVCVDGEQVLGFLVSRALVDEREILNVAVDPAYRGRGTGRSLVERELQMGAAAWFLEVRESNAAALALYRRAGFQEAGKRAAYYSDPVESAIVMRIFS